MFLGRTVIALVLQVFQGLHQMFSGLRRLDNIIHKPPARGDVGRCKHSAILFD